MYIDDLNNFVNIARNFDNNQNVNPNGPIPVYNNWNQVITINELVDQLRNSNDWQRMKAYVKITIDYILFHTRSPQAQYMNNFEHELNNDVGWVNNMIFTPEDEEILRKIMSIVNMSTRTQKKEIFNMFSNL